MNAVITWLEHLLDHFRHHHDPENHPAPAAPLPPAPEHVATAVQTALAGAPVGSPVANNIAAGNAELAAYAQSNSQRHDVTQAELDAAAAGGAARAEEHARADYDINNPGSYRTYPPSHWIDIPGPGTLNIAGGETGTDVGGTYMLQVSGPEGVRQWPANTSQANIDVPVIAGRHTISVDREDVQLNLRAEFKPA